MEGNTENIFSKILVGVAIAVLSAVVIYQFNLDPAVNIHLDPQKPEIEQTSPEVKKTDLSGVYNGFCYNRTYRQSGKLILNIRQGTTGDINGTINITGNLFGSGDLEGHFDGKKIGFTSREITTGLLISWEGRVQDNKLSGDYTVSLPPYLKAQTGLIDQTGDWEATK